MPPIKQAVEMETYLCRTPSQLQISLLHSHLYTAPNSPVPASLCTAIDALLSTSVFAQLWATYTLLCCQLYWPTGKSSNPDNCRALLYHCTANEPGTASIKPSCCFDAGGTEWQTALVTNRCPECLFGSIDQAIDGNGRWQVQWFATPCPVGDSKLMYSITVIDQYWFSLVVSNTL